MKAAQSKPSDELSMSAKEFDRIMGQALKVKPEDVKKQKPAAKTKAGKKPK